MDQTNRIIMLMGSNQNAEENIKLAEAELRDYFPRIAFSEPVYTEPVGTNYNTPFLNRVAVAYTADRPEEIIVCFKLIEQVLGRTPADKLVGSIPIDIDLLQWNEQVLKKEDVKRDYVIDGIRSLSSE